MIDLSSARSSIRQSNMESGKEEVAPMLLLSGQNLSRYSSLQIDSHCEGGNQSAAQNENAEREAPLVQPNFGPKFGNDDSANQINPLLSLFLLALAMIILAIVTIYTKLMI